MTYLNGLNALSSLGDNDDDAIKNINAGINASFENRTGYLPNSISAYLGKLPFIAEDCEHRNNSLAMLCIAKLDHLIKNAIDLFGSKRIGLVVGTSTSAISDVELFQKLHPNKEGMLTYNPEVYEIGSISEFLRKKLNILGPCYTVATACSSAAHALISAKGLLDANLCDAVIAGGTDSLSQITVGGFHALGALSIDPCLPFHKDRHGINIGEGAGFTLVTREPLESGALKLLGYGTTSDAHHISAPDPTGNMGIIAVEKALEMANLKPSDIGYVNMHGTGTKLNDAMEGNIIRAIFDGSIPISSSKHLTGHTLGAAAIVEAYICKLILQQNANLPFQPYQTNEYFEEFGDLNLVTLPNTKPKTKVVMSNSFAFGGNNVSLIFGV